MSFTIKSWQGGVFLQNCEEHTLSSHIEDKPQQISVTFRRKSFNKSKEKVPADELKTRESPKKKRDSHIEIKSDISNVQRGNPRPIEYFQTNPENPQLKLPKPSSLGSFVDLKDETNPIVLNWGESVTIDSRIPSKKRGFISFQLPKTTRTDGSEGKDVVGGEFVLSVLPLGNATSDVYISKKSVHSQPGPRLDCHLWKSTTDKHSKVIIPVRCKVKSTGSGHITQQEKDLVMGEIVTITLRAGRSTFPIDWSIPGINTSDINAFIRIKASLMTGGEIINLGQEVCRSIEKANSHSFCVVVPSKLVRVRLVFSLVKGDADLVACFNATKPSLTRHTWHIRGKKTSKSALQTTTSSTLLLDASQSQFRSGPLYFSIIGHAVLSTYSILVDMETLSLSEYKVLKSVNEDARPQLRITTCPFAYSEPLSSPRSERTKESAEKSKRANKQALIPIMKMDRILPWGVLQGRQYMRETKYARNNEAQAKPEKPSQAPLLEKSDSFTSTEKQELVGQLIQSSVYTNDAGRSSNRPKSAPLRQLRISLISPTSRPLSADLTKIKPSSFSSDHDQIPSVVYGIPAIRVHVRSKSTPSSATEGSSNPPSIDNLADPPNALHPVEDLPHTRALATSSSFVPQAISNMPLQDKQKHIEKIEKTLSNEFTHDTSPRQSFQEHEGKGGQIHRSSINSTPSNLILPSQNTQKKVRRISMNPMNEDEQAELFDATIERIQDLKRLTQRKSLATSLEAINLSPLQTQGFCNAIVIANEESVAGDESDEALHLVMKATQDLMLDLLKSAQTLQKVTKDPSGTDPFRRGTISMDFNHTNENIRRQSFVSPHPPSSQSVRERARDRRNRRKSSIASSSFVGSFALDSILQVHENRQLNAILEVESEQNLSQDSVERKIDSLIELDQPKSVNASKGSNFAQELSCNEFDPEKSINQQLIQANHLNIARKTPDDIARYTNIAQLKHSRKVENASRKATASIAAVCQIDSQKKYAIHDMSQSSPPKLKSEKRVPAPPSNTLSTYATRVSCSSSGLRARKIRLHHMNSERVSVQDLIQTPRDSVTIRLPELVLPEMQNVEKVEIETPSMRWRDELHIASLSTRREQIIRWNNIVNSRKENGAIPPAMLPWSRLCNN